ncbi:MAG: hypothetical protein GF331_19195, partial [Chitinivibrionales bacterium]|nr:hypothetical protein [Chitinivibrionales bacterium]
MRQRLAIPCLFAIALVGARAIAQTIDITGTVLSSDSTPLAEAVVSLSALSLSTTTDVDGTFRLYREDETQLTGAGGAPQWRRPRLVGSTMRFTTLEPKEQVRLSVYSLTGRQLVRSIVRFDEPGEHRLHLDAAIAGEQPCGTFVVRLDIGGCVRSFTWRKTRHSGLGGRGGEQAGAGRAVQSKASRAAAVDSLVIRKPGYIVSRLPLEALEVDLDTLYVDSLYDIALLQQELDSLVLYGFAGEENPVMSRLLLRGDTLVDSLLGVYGADLASLLNGDGLAFARQGVHACLVAPSAAASPPADFRQSYLDVMQSTSAAGILRSGRYVPLDTFSLAAIVRDSVRVSTFHDGFQRVDTELSAGVAILESYLPSNTSPRNLRTVTYAPSGAGKTRFFLGAILSAASNMEAASAAASAASAARQAADAAKKNARLLSENRERLVSLDAKVTAYQESVEDSIAQLSAILDQTRQSIERTDTAIQSLSANVDLLAGAMRQLDAGLAQALDELNGIEGEILYLKEYISGSILIQQINSLRGKITTFSNGPSYDLAVSILNDYDGLVLNFITFAMNNYTAAKESGQVDTLIQLEARVPVMQCTGITPNRDCRALPDWSGLTAPDYPEYSPDFESTFKDTVLT